MTRYSIGSHPAWAGRQRETPRRFRFHLGAIACFFEQPWSRVSPALTEADQAWLLDDAAFTLRALGRLTEALEPMRAGLGMYRQGAGPARRQQPDRATLAMVAAATDAEQSVSLRERSTHGGEARNLARTRRRAPGRVRDLPRGRGQCRSSGSAETRCILTVRYTATCSSPPPSRCRQTRSFVPIPNLRLA